ncbi:hypothetical protein EXIGLDRAFT_735495, partial [Exidia glandulosa HHB12029]
MVVYLSDPVKDEFDVADLGRMDDPIRHANSRTRVSRAVPGTQAFLTWCLHHASHAYL